MERVLIAVPSLRTLGRSGLVVSPLALGTMTFGTDRWGADEATSRAIFDAYRGAGGNVIDTADVYAGGASEEMVGRFLAETGSRDELVVATKFGFHAAASPLDAEQAGGGNPHAGGAGAKHVHQALAASLRRLGTDYVDLYWMHIWDGVTPVAEIVQTLGDLVRAGRIRYYALSDMPAWVATKAATIAAERGVPGPIAVQVEYSLVARDVEREHVPAARDAGLGGRPVEPAGRRLPDGKYRRDRRTTPDGSAAPTRSVTPSSPIATGTSWTCCVASPRSRRPRPRRSPWPGSWPGRGSRRRWSGPAASPSCTTTWPRRS